MENKSQKSVLGQLREMGIGEVLTFPISMRSSVKTSMYVFGPEWGKKFTGHTDGCVFHVERIA